MISSTIVASARRQNPAETFVDDATWELAATSFPQVGQNFESAGEPQCGQNMTKC